MTTPIDPAVEKAAVELRNKFKALRAEIGKAIVGHSEVIDGVLGVRRINSGGGSV